MQQKKLCVSYFYDLTFDLNFSLNIDIGLNICVHKLDHELTLTPYFDHGPEIDIVLKISTLNLICCFDSFQFCPKIDFLLKINLNL